MRTVLIRVGRRRHADGYPVWLYAEGDHRERWYQTPLAEAVIPDGLYRDELAALGIGPDDDIVGALREQVLGGSRRPGATSVIGRYLGSVLACGAVGAQWDLLVRADEVRFLLHVEDPELRRLPWELMQRTAGFLFNSPKRPWSRLEDDASLDLPEQPAAGHDRYPLRVLVVVSSEAGAAALQAEEEVYAIVAALRSSEPPLEWHVERRPTIDELGDLLRWFRPHVLHFIGHSGSAVLPGAAQDFLRVHAERGPAWDYTPPLISQHLEEWTPELVVLNACRLSGQGASSHLSESMWSVARTYSEARVPAVVAMQGDVRGEDARAFAAALYRELLVEGRDIDAAVAFARSRIEDFGFPCLTLHQRPDTVLRLPPIGLPPTALVGLRDTYRPAPFVNRCEERGRLAAMLAQGRAQLITVVGPREVGKSWLVRTTLFATILRGANVAYVDLSNDGIGRQRTWLEVLELIRKAFNSSPTHGASNQAALAGLDLAAGATDRVRSDDQIADLCHAVRRRLTDAARRTGGLLFALDHLDSAAEEFRDTVGARLLAPIADGEVEGVRALVVCCDDEAHTRRWPYVGDLGSTFAVRGLPKHAWVPLATTLLYELGWEKRAADQARSWDWIVPDPWDAVALDALVIADKRMRKQAGR